MTNLEHSEMTYITLPGERYKILIIKWHIIAFTGSKLQAMRDLRMLFGLTLIEVKYATENLPYLVIETSEESKLSEYYRLLDRTSLMIEETQIIRTRIA